MHDPGFCFIDRQRLVADPEALLLRLKSRYRSFDQLRVAALPGWRKFTSPGGQIDIMTHAQDERPKLVYADPPWPFTTYSAKGKGRSQEAFYDTMPLADIAALPVREMAAADSVLLLWVANPILPQVFQIIEAWGFTYKTIGFTWVKLTRASNGGEAVADMRFHFGLGFWARANPEICLLATRGKPTRLHADVPQLAAAAGVCRMLRRRHDWRSRLHHLQGNAAACTAHAGVNGQQRVRDQAAKD